MELRTFSVASEHKQSVCSTCYAVSSRNKIVGILIGFTVMMNKNDANTEVVCNAFQHRHLLIVRTVLSVEHEPSSSNREEGLKMLVLFIIALAVISSLLPVNLRSVRFFVIRMVP